MSRAPAKKPTTLSANFAQGTQRIARIKELVAEPVAFVIEPEPHPEQELTPVDAPISDAELASAFEGEEPMAANRVKRAASAYKTVVLDERPIIIVA